MGLAEPLCLLPGAASLLRGFPPAQLCLLSSASLGTLRVLPQLSPVALPLELGAAALVEMVRTTSRVPELPLGLLSTCSLPPWQLALTDHSECAMSALKLQNQPRYS